MAVTEEGLLIKLADLELLASTAEIQIAEMDNRITNLTAAVEHAKREFYLRGRRDMLHEILTEADERGLDVVVREMGLRQWYETAVKELEGFPLAH